MHSVPVYYLGRLRERAAVVWDWTKQRGRLALPWWGRSSVKGEFRALFYMYIPERDGVDCLRNSEDVLLYGHVDVINT